MGRGSGRRGRADTPAQGTPRRRPAGLRRTSTIDTRTTGDGTINLVGRARDIATAADGSVLVLGDATVEAELAPDRLLRRLHVQPDRHEAAALQGASVGAGFRRAADAAFPGERDTPLGALLDDLPIAAMLSSYAQLRELARADGPPPVGPRAATGMENLCAGWRTGGALLTSITAGHGVPFQACPPALPFPDEDDPEGWHDAGQVPAWTMRRTRRLDLTPGAPVLVDAVFRDSYGEPDGTEVVLHEYGLEATLEPSSLVIETARAAAHVLPYEECSHAAASAASLAGTAVAGVRTAVRDELVGISSCTHLNDLLRTLSCVPALLARPAG